MTGAICTLLRGVLHQGGHGGTASASIQVIFTPSAFMIMAVVGRIKSRIVGSGVSIISHNTKTYFFNHENSFQIGLESLNGITILEYWESLEILLSRTQAGPGRTVKEEQEEISPNHVQRINLLSVHYVIILFHLSHIFISPALWTDSVCLFKEHYRHAP